MAGYLWVRSQVQTVAFDRRRQGAVLVAGDILREEFTLANKGRLPILWAEFVDFSDLPNYAPGSVVAAPVGGSYAWWKEVECARRGVFRLGPHHLRIGDPFGLFSAEIRYDRYETLLIYPRVVQLPQVELPRGSAGGSAPRRRPMLGVLPAASVRDYAQGDSMRHIHWPSTAHRSHLMVKELELEPSGDVWIVLNLHDAVQRGEGRDRHAGVCNYSGRQHGRRNGQRPGTAGRGPADCVRGRGNCAAAAGGPGTAVGNHGGPGARPADSLAAGRAAAPQPE